MKCSVTLVQHSVNFCISCSYIFFCIFSGAASGTRSSKRKSKASQSLSPDNVGSMTRRRLSTRLCKSPLSRTNVDNARIGGTADNPVIVEEVLVETSKGASKRQKLHLKVSMCLSMLVLFLMDDTGSWMLIHVIVCSGLLLCLILLDSTKAVIK